MSRAAVSEPVRCFIWKVVWCLIPAGFLWVSPVLGQPVLLVEWLRGLPPQAQATLQLSHPDFQTRQQAEQQLLDAGLQAWDWLYRAAGSREPEVARSASRLLQQIPYEDELARLVPFLASYRQANQAGRVRMLIRLGQESLPEAQAALALLTRVESDEQLSRRAAIELITSPQRPISDLSERLGTSSRVASDWLRIHAATANNFQDFTARWHPAMVAMQTDPLASSCLDETQQIVLWYVTQLLLRNEEALAGEMIQSVIDRIPAQAVAVVEMFDWLLLYRQLSACDRLMTRFPDLMQSDTRLVVRRAELARQRGDLTQADQYAQTALRENDPADHESRLQAAIHLQLAGLHHWSAQQLQSLVDDPLTGGAVRVQACSLLAEMQGQNMEFEAARETLAKALREAPVEEPGVQSLREQLQTRHHFYSHLWGVENGDWKAAEQHLWDGLQGSPNDSDLLIAMSRYAGPPADLDGQWQETAGQLIQLALQSRLTRIESLRIGYDEDTRQARLRQELLVCELNAYAWLASQTGVALPQAESLAREARQLSPADGHVLDTLAACLFARAKLSEALVWQQQALRYAPWSSQIRGGLDRYRQAMMLAEIQGLVR